MMGLWLCCILRLNVSHWIEQRLAKLVVCVLGCRHLWSRIVTRSAICASEMLPTLVPLIHFILLLARLK